MRFGRCRSGPPRRVAVRSSAGRELVPGLIIGHFAHASRRVPGARERALRARGQITLGSPLLFRGESSATAARISRRAQAAAAVAATSANESRCVWPLSSRPDAPTLGQSISRARAPAGTLPRVTHAPGSDPSGLDTYFSRLNYVSPPLQGLPPSGVSPSPRAPRAAAAGASFL